MSQVSFLESVVTWDDAQCRQNLQDALPKLLSHLHEATLLQEELGILKIICVSFLPWVDIQQAEETVLSHVSIKSCAMLDRVLSELTELPKTSSLQGELQSLIELLTELLDCYTVCVKHVITQGGNSINIAHIHSLPCGAIHLLKGSYTHCKESSTVYGDVLASITEPLSMLFKKAHTLQQALLSLLEAIVVDGTASDQDVQDLTNVCEGLFEVCQIVSSLDVKLVISLWKAVSRLSGKHKYWLKDSLNVDTMVTYLCTEIEKGYSFMLQLAPPEHMESELSLSQGDSAAFQRSLKVVGYQLRVIISLLDNFVDHLSHCIPATVHLVITILSSLPPSLESVTIAPQYIDDIKRQLVNGIEPLLNLILRNRSLLQYILQNMKEIKKEERLAYIQLLVKILDCLPKQHDEVYRCWMNAHSDTDGTTNILHQLFCLLSHCHVEVSVCMMEVSGKPASLYQFLCVHVCAFVASLPAKYFMHLEECMLQHFLSPAPLVSRLVHDVWCFMARYGSAELCFSHTTLLLDTCSHVGHTAYTVNLSKRLLKFLAPEHQAKLLAQYPHEKHGKLWSSIFIPVLYSTITLEKRTDLVQKACCTVQSFLQKTDRTFSDMSSFHESLCCLCSLLKCDEKSELTSVAMETVHKVWLSWDTKWLGEIIFTQCLVRMTELAGFVISQLSNSCVFQILNILTENVTRDNQTIKLSSCRFLQRCKRVTFSPDPTQALILKKMPVLFHTLLLDRDSVVHHTALEAFTEFAESTPFESLVPECLGDNQTLQDTVVAFLSKTVHETADYSEVRYLQQQSDQLHGAYNTLTQSPPGMIRDMDDVTMATEPATKRKRCDLIQEDDSAAGINCVVGDINLNVQKLEKLLINDTLPESAISKLLELNTRLKHILDKYS